MEYSITVTTVPCWSRIRGDQRELLEGNGISAFSEDRAGVNHPKGRLRASHCTELALSTGVSLVRCRDSSGAEGALPGQVFQARGEALASGVLLVKQVWI